MNRQNVLIFLPAKDFNEEEFIIIKDSLQKAIKNIFIASDSNGLCIGEKGLKIKADINILNIHPSNFAALVIIGGSGVLAYWDNPTLQVKVKQFFETGKVVSAICAAPIILGKAGILRSADATCCPKFSNELKQTGANLTENPVVSIGNIITGMGASASQEFSNNLISKINKL